MTVRSTGQQAGLYALSHDTISHTHFPLAPLRATLYHTNLLMSTELATKCCTVRLTAVLDDLPEAVYGGAELVRDKLNEIQADLQQLAFFKPTNAINSDDIVEVIEKKHLPYIVIWDVLD